MIRTAWSLMIALSALSFTTACKDGGGNKGDDTDAPADDTEPTGDDSVDSSAGLLLPEFFGFTGGFAHEKIEDIARPYLFDGEESQPFMILTLATEDWLRGNSDDESCVIYIDQPGTHPRAAWATEAESFLFGVNFSITEESSFSTNCTEVFDIDEEYLITFLTDVGMACTWGFGTTPEIDGDVEDQLGDEAANFLGGYVHFNDCEMFDDEGIEVGLTSAFEVDEDWELFEDADQIDAETMLETFDLPAEVPPEETDAAPVETDPPETDAPVETDTPEPPAPVTVTRLTDGYFEVQTFIFYSLQ